MDNFDAQAFGKAVRESRLSENLTQERLAEEVNITVRYLSDIEKGARTPGMKLMLALCLKLNISIDEFLFPIESVTNSTIKRQTLKSLDSLHKNELHIINATIRGIIESREK